MKKALVLGILLALMLSVAVGTAAIELGVTVIDGSLVLLYDDFEDGDYTSNPTWNVDWTHSGDPDGSEHGLSLPQLRTDHTYYFEGTTTRVPELDYKVTAILYTDNPTNIGSWQFDSRLSSADDLYNGIWLEGDSDFWNGVGYMVDHHWNSGNPTIRLSRYDSKNDLSILIETGPVSIGWHTIKVTRDSSATWELFVDGVSKGTAIDNTYEDLSVLGIGRYGGFDNILVSILIEVPATIDIDPDVLNLNSKGKWITAYIELANGYDVNEIDVGTVILDVMIPAELEPTEIGDYDSDGIADLMVKFNRRSLIGYLEGMGVEDGEEVELTVTGEFNDGTPFAGSDTIRVIDKDNK